MKDVLKEIRALATKQDEPFIAVLSSSMLLNLLDIVEAAYDVNRIIHATPESSANHWGMPFERLNYYLSRFPKDGAVPPPAHQDRTSREPG